MPAPTTTSNCARSSREPSFGPPDRDGEELSCNARVSAQWVDKKADTRQLACGLAPMDDPDLRAYKGEERNRRGHCESHSPRLLCHTPPTARILPKEHHESLRHGSAPAALRRARRLFATEAGGAMQRPSCCGGVQLAGASAGAGWSRYREPLRERFTILPIRKSVHHDAVERGSSRLR